MSQQRKGPDAIADALGDAQTASVGNLSKIPVGRQRFWLALRLSLRGWYQAPLRRLRSPDLSGALAKFRAKIQAISTATTSRTRWCRFISRRFSASGLSCP